MFILMSSPSLELILNYVVMQINYDNELCCFNLERRQLGFLCPSCIFNVKYSSTGYKCHQVYLQYLSSFSIDIGIIWFKQNLEIACGRLVIISLWLPCDHQLVGALWSSVCECVWSFACGCLVIIRLWFIACGCLVIYSLLVPCTHQLVGV